MRQFQWVPTRNDLVENFGIYLTFTEPQRILLYVCDVLCCITESFCASLYFCVFKLLCITRILTDMFQTYFVRRFFDRCIVIWTLLPWEEHFVMFWSVYLYVNTITFVTKIFIYLHGPFTSVIFFSPFLEHNNSVSSEIPCLCIMMYCKKGSLCCVQAYIIHLSSKFF